MKGIFALLLIIAAAGSTRAQSTNAPPETRLSPAERSMAEARKRIEKNPDNFEAYNALAMALSRRARESSDDKFYAQAEDALHKSFAISPKNFDGEKTQVWLLLGKHEFAEALEQVKRLNRKMPDDVMLYGFLADANAELGNYTAAETAVQWMLDLRPGNLPGLTRAAYLRELYGDNDGALELLHMAYQSTAPNEVEEAALILTQMAHLNLGVGRVEQADKLLRQALTTFPDYDYALGQLSTVRILQRRYVEAVEVLQRLCQSTPYAKNLYALAEAQELAGRGNEAKQTFAQFEQKALAESDKADNSNHELVYFYANHAQRPAEALRIARLEFSRRQDVHTLDAYAWALDANRKYDEAAKEMERALGVGIRDGEMLYRAGAIAAHRHDQVTAQRYWEKSMQLNSLGSKESREAVERSTVARSN